MGNAYKILDQSNNEIAELWCAGPDELLYRLADGSLLAMDTCMAWCDRCATFIEAERLIDVEAIEDEIAKLPQYRGYWWKIQRGVLRLNHYPRRPSSEELDAELRGSDRLADEAKREIARLKRKRAWRSGRESAPRCLRCGSVDITPVPCDAEVFAHPRTGAEMHLDWQGHYETDYRPIHFDEEGCRIPSV